MSYALSHNAFTCLKAQTNLTGHFTHILRDESNGALAKATIQTEVYLDQVTVIVRMGPTVNTLTLPANCIATTRKIASHLEAIANGQLDTADMPPIELLLDDAA
ncbi:MULTISPECIES: hypothetical protein [unclassified Pseudomonas]|uniref:hypothetical protein n=1 Tax=unclassified Pseudomonas TaxID=196821 RepID=UPI0020975722|nr:MULTISPECIES: hypothetical protein [unclassified Pseudomonas]MCO7519158.1 hypothetical protein [Pseudomonas sp. 1]MCO7540112.1 hypothetical protein [Pseudomonas sp. VA159-2]